MAYNGKLPGKDEVANLIINALRQDKKDVVLSADIQAEIDQSSLKAAEKQIDELTKKRTVDVDISKAEQKIRNLMEPLREVEREIKALSTSGANFNVAHNTIKRYEQLRQAIAEATKSIGQNNEALTEAHKLIRSIDGAIKGLDITVEKAAKKTRTRRKKSAADDIVAQTEAMTAQVDATRQAADVTAEYGDAIDGVSKQLEEQIALQQEQTEGLQRATRAQRELNKEQSKGLKLQPKRDKSGARLSGAYATEDGLFEVDHDADGWKVHRKNAAGLYELVKIYKTKKDVVHDSALIAEQEAYAQKKAAGVITDAVSQVEQEMRALSDAYEEMANRAGHSAKFAGQYSAMFKAVQGGALSATDAIAQLNKAIDEMAGKKTTGAIPVVKPKYYEIDEEAARRAKENRSFDDYEKDSATKAYRAAVDALEQVVKEKKEKFPDKADQLDELLDKYARNLAKFINRDNQIGAQYPSVMISGAGNYNIKKHDRQMASWGKNYEYYDSQVLAIENQIKNLGSSGAVAIRGDDEDALEKLEARLEYMKYWHQVMVEVNKYYRKNKTLEGFTGAEPDELERIQKALDTMKQLGMHDVPYPQYTLTNDNQNIKRIEGRIAELKRLKADGGKSDTLHEENEFYKMWVDKTDMRIRISFEMGKPEQEIIDMLKGKAFKWSPKNGAWQRQLTDNAIYDAKSLQESLRTHFQVDNPPEQQMDFLPKLTSSYEGLADAVQRYVDASKKLWEAYDAGKDFGKFADERNTAIEQIAQHFPQRADGVDSTLLRDGYRMYLQDQGWSRAFAMDGAESALKSIEADLGHVEEGINRAKNAAEEANQQMQKTATLIGELHTKYGDKFGEIFDKTINPFGGLNIANAEDMYDDLIAREKEYVAEIQHRVEMVAKVNSMASNAYTDSVPIKEFSAKVADLAQQIMDGKIGFDAAAQSITEFVDAMVRSSDAVDSNELLIDSYEDLSKAVQRYISLARQLKPTETEEYSKIQSLIDGTDHIWDSKELAPEIKAWYTNVQRIKSSLKNGLSVYRHTYSDGDTAEYDIGDSTLADAEAKLRGYIYLAAQGFGELIPEIMDGLDKKRMRAFVEDEIAKYTQIDKDNLRYSLDAKAFNLPIEEEMTTIATMLVSMAQEAGAQVEDILYELSHRVEDLNRYTVSMETNTLGSLIGIVTPHDDLHMNAKVIKSYEELCAVVERYNALNDRSVRYGGDFDAGLSVQEEKEYQTLRGRLMATGGDDVFKHTSWGQFKDVEKLATALGIKIPAPQVEMQPKVETGSVEEAVKNDASKPVEVPVKPVVAEDLSRIVSRDILDKLLNGIDVDDLFRRAGMQGDNITIASDLFRDLAGAMYLGDQSPKNWQEIFNEIFEFVTKSAQYTKPIEKVMGPFREFMKNKQIKITESMEPEFAAEFPDEWKSIKRLYAIGGKGQKAKKLITKSKYSSSPDTLIESIIANNHGDALDPKMMSDYNGNVYDALRIIVDAVRRARAEVHAPSTQTFVGLDDEMQEIFSGHLLTAMNTVEQNISAMRSSIAAATAGEDEFADAANRAADATKKQADAVHDTADTIQRGKSGGQLALGGGILRGDEGDAEEKVRIIEKTVTEALEQLRNAKDNKNTMIDLSAVQSPDDLNTQIGNLVTKALGADLHVGSVVVNEDIARIQLYNKELGITTQQVWRLKAATEEAEQANLEFVSADPLRVDFKAARQYAEAQEKALSDGEKSLLGYQKRLDTLTRGYQHGSKTLKGDSNLLLPDATTLHDDADKTLDGLADHIQSRIKTLREKLASGEKMTKDDQNLFIQDLNALENEIKTMQADTYKQGNMSATEVNELRKSLTAMLETLASKARRNNVFDAISDSYHELHNNLNNKELPGYLTDQNISDAVQRIRTLSKETTKEIQLAGETKKEQHDLQQLLNLQERLYEAKKRQATLKIGGDTSSSAYLKAERTVQELEQQYEAAKKLFTEEEQVHIIEERRLKLLKELAAVIREQHQSKNAAEAQDKQQADAEQVKQTYKSLLEIVTKINALNSDITKYQKKDGGSGMFAGYIQQLQLEKEQLVTQLQGITGDISKSLGDGFVQGKEYTLPFNKILDSDDGSISNFFNDVRTQTALTTEEIEKFISTLQNSQKIDADGAARVAEMLKPAQDTYAKLSSLSNLDKNNTNYQAVLGMYSDIQKYITSLPSDPTQWSAKENANLQKLIDNAVKYGNILAQAGQQEERYFSDKSRYAAGATMESVAEDAKKASEEVGTAQQKLTDAAKKFAQDSGTDAIITKFATGADGISKLDFSVFDKAINSLRSFRMEMGSVSDGMYVTETTVNKSLANIQAAQKQVQSIQDLIGRLGASGVNINADTAIEPVQRLLTIQKQLSEEASKGSNADQGLIADLTKRAKIAITEVERLYKTMVQMEGAIEGKQMTSVGVGDPTGNVYGQLTKAAQDFAKTQPGATLELGRFDDKANTLNVSMVRANGAVEEFQFRMDSLSGQMTYQQAGVGKLTTSWDRFKASLGRAGKQLMTAFVGYNIFFKAISEVRKGIGYVKEIDLALTELKKVTDETEASYRKFLQTAASTAGEIGSTVSDFTEATANFARLGYSMSESAEMAKTAIVYRNVADGLDTVEEATDSIISTMKAFGIESDNTMGIVDRFNEVGNNFAITSAGIGDALQRSASALYSAGNTIDESIALVTAANSVIQNPEQVGTALKTLALRLRGAKVELEEAGLETDNMAESTSTLQAKLKALTHGKVDIMADADTFKNTTQILREMSAAWEDMTDIERAAALELMGGKRQANILSSVITNFETVEEVIQTSMDSSGSAMAENAKWLDSIEGKTYKFTNALEAMWNNMLDSHVIKGFLDFGTNAIQFLDTIPGQITAVIAALAGFAKFQGINFLQLFPDVWHRIQQYAKMSTQLSALSSKKLGLNLGSAEKGWNDAGLNAYANAVKGLTANEQAELLIKQRLNREQITEIMRRAGVKDEVIKETLSKKNLLTTTGSLQKATVKDVITTEMATDAKQKEAIATFLAENGHKRLTKALLDEARARGAINDEQYLAFLNQIQGSLGGVLKQLLKSPGVIMMVSMAISSFISTIKTAQEKTEELTEEFNNLQSSMSEIEGEIDSLDSELEKIQGRIDEINAKDKLSIADAEELRLLQQQSAELKDQKKLQEQLLTARESQEDAKSLQMINNLLKTTAAGQQKAAEDTANAWKIALGVLAAAGLFAAGFVSGGSTWAAVPGALGLAFAGAQVGGAIGEHAGHYIGMSDNEAGGSLIEWYESYEEAIANAEKEASEAEAKYLNDMTEKNREKWQKKLEYVNTLRTEMYDGLTEMQGYISNLEYDDSTKGIIDGYNDLMTHLSIKSNDGSIDGQISAIQSLQDEFYELSRGVDKNGKNVALTAEEYARYRDIVDQILSYAPGLIQGYDEEGNAILGAADAQFTYNQLIAESIELLKQQRIEAQKKAAIQIVYGDKAVGGRVNTYDDDGIVDAYKDGKVAVDTSYDTIYADIPVAKGSLTSTVAEDIVANTIRVKADGFWNVEGYDVILENWALVAENRDKIEAALKQAHAEAGYTGPSADEYIDKYMKWLDGIVQKARDANEQTKINLTKILQQVPLTMDSYYELESGASIDFINKYIKSYVDSFGDVTNLTDKQVKQMRDHVKDITDKIARSTTMQDAIAELYKLDPSKVPVRLYTNELKKLTQQMLDEGIIEQTDVNKDGIVNMLADMFIGDVPIDEMKSAIKKKLKTSSQGLIENLSLEELRVAYKILPELSDNINFEELRAEIKERLPKATGPIVQTYSALVEQTDKVNEAVAQTSEIILDNTKVTQEYKDSLIELGVSSEELAECFDATNNLVVVNAKKLNELVNGTKKTAAQNVQLAKSQARLQYYELYKEMDKLVDANGDVEEGNLDVVRSLYQEMNALEKTISRYSILEAKLLGSANAYEKFQEAQEIDSNLDYISNAAEMVLALGEAFNTAELGTETAQAAIMGLVPKSVYKDLDTVDEKMAAIYEYFKDGELSKYFTIKFDDDGKIESAEMKLGNIQKFIEDGLNGDRNQDGINPFIGEDWQHFGLNEDWLNSLPKDADILDELAKQMNVTKEVAFAFVKSLEDHDIQWLDGDYSTFFDQMLASTTEGKVQLYTERLADFTMQQAALVAERNELEKQYKNGAISKEEYTAKVDELTKKQEELNTKIGDYNTKLAEAKNLSTQNIFGVGAQGTQYEGQADYQLKTHKEIAETDNVDDLDNWIERNEKVKQLSEEQAAAQAEYQKALEEHDAAVKANGGRPLDSEHTAVTNLKDAEDTWHAVTKKVSEAIAARDEFVEPTVLEIQLAIDDLETQMEDARKTLDEKLANGVKICVKVDGKQMEEDVSSTDELLQACFHMDEHGYWEIRPGVDLDTLRNNYPEIFSYVQMLNSKTTLTAGVNDTEAKITLETLSGQIEDIITLLEDMKISLDPKSVEEFVTKLGELCRPQHISAYIDAFWKGFKGEGPSSAETESGDAQVGGTAHVRGTAYASGDWGLSASEHNALVGELGPEMVVDPYSGRYYTVGDNGAEMVDLPKGAIIFNHQQTKSLLESGHIASRGKAYAQGNAHAMYARTTIFDGGASKDQLDTSDSSKSDSTDNDFDDIMDWIEVRMEEIEDVLSRLSAELENAVGYVEKNNKIEAMIAKNREKLADSYAGADYYENYAQQFYNKIPAQYQEMAKNGEIAITDFAGKASEATVEAIQKYRDYIQKADDLRQQAEETLTEIRDLAVQAIDNIQEHGSAMTAIEDAQTEKLQNRVDLDEERGVITSSAYYAAMMENSGKKIDYLTPIFNDMQAAFNKAVQDGDIKVGSVEWYEQLGKLYEVKSEIDGATIELEEFQNAINDINWDNFDQLISRLGYLKDETQNLIDLMEKEDLVVDPAKSKYDGGTIEYWTADDVKWTEEGLASLGLYAQKMEIAEFESKQYAQAIANLTKEYEAGHYSENEYLEKFDELKSAQYDSIQEYYDAQDAIKDLNQTRIDSIKDGIQKEIDAYEELIEKKKEELSTEKDLYDFQKSIAESSKNIAEIERKIAALSNDNSMSAIAKRRQLEAELAEAKANQDELYYNRGIDKQQEALDKELDDFQETKGKEIEKWDKYLEDVETLIADSLNIVQENAGAIGQRLTDKAKEYNLTVSDAILTPWKDGALAVSDYQTTFDTAMSSTMDQLESLKNKWIEIIEQMSKAGKLNVDIINQENAKYAEAEKVETAMPAPQPEPKPETPSTAGLISDLSGTIKYGNKGDKVKKLQQALNALGFGNSGTAGVDGNFGEKTLAAVKAFQKAMGISADGIVGPKTKEKFKLKGYAMGTTGVDRDQLALIDELGDELTLHAQNGKLAFLTKGSAVIPHDISENLMKLGSLDPSDVLGRSAPQIGIHPEVHNTEVNITMEIAEVVHIDQVTQDTIPDLTKAVRKEMDSYMLKVNNAIKAKVR